MNRPSQNTNSDQGIVDIVATDAPTTIAVIPSAPSTNTPLKGEVIKGSVDVAGLPQQEPQVVEAPAIPDLDSAQAALGKVVSSNEFKNSALPHVPNPLETTVATTLVAAPASVVSAAPSTAQVAEALAQAQQLQAAQAQAALLAQAHAAQVAAEAQVAAQTVPGRTSHGSKPDTISQATDEAAKLRAEAENAATARATDSKTLATNAEGRVVDPAASIYQIDTKNVVNQMVQGSTAPPPPAAGGLMTEIGAAGTPVSQTPASPGGGSASGLAGGVSGVGSHSSLDAQNSGPQQGGAPQGQGASSGNTVVNVPPTVIIPSSQGGNETVIPTATRIDSVPPVTSQNQPQPLQVSAPPSSNVSESPRTVLSAPEIRNDPLGTPPVARAEPISQPQSGSDIVRTVPTPQVKGAEPQVPQQDVGRRPIEAPRDPERQRVEPVKHESTRVEPVQRETRTQEAPPSRIIREDPVSVQRSPAPTVDATQKSPPASVPAERALQETRQEPTRVTSSTPQVQETREQAPRVVVSGQDTIDRTALKSDEKGGTTKDLAVDSQQRLRDRIEQSIKEEPVVREITKRLDEEKKSVGVSAGTSGGSGSGEKEATLNNRSDLARGKLDPNQIVTEVRGTEGKELSQLIRQLVEKPDPEKLAAVIATIQKQLPGTEGKELAQVIRQLVEKPDTEKLTAVIATLQKQLPGTEGKELSQAIRQLVEKPDPEKLAAVIATIQKQLPGTEGKELAQVIRQLVEKPDTEKLAAVIATLQKQQPVTDVKDLPPIIRRLLENSDPEKLAATIQALRQQGLDIKIGQKPDLPVQLAKNFEEVVKPQMTKQEAIQALLGLLVGVERLSNQIVNEIKVETQVKLGQIQGNIDEVLKLRVQQFIALGAKNGIKEADFQKIMHESLNELATRYGLTEAQRILLARIMSSISTSSFEKKDVIEKDPQKAKQIADAEKLKALKLKENIPLREATPEEIAKMRRAEIDILEKLLKERDEVRRALAELKLKELLAEQNDEEVEYRIDENLEVIKVYKIKGQVVDRETGKPIAGLTIVGGLLGTRITNSDGYFEYINVPQDTVYMIGPDDSSYTFDPPFHAGSVSMGVQLEFKARKIVH